MCSADPPALSPGGFCFVQPRVGGVIWATTPQAAGARPPRRWEGWAGAGAARGPPCVAIGRGGPATWPACGRRCRRPQPTRPTSGPRVAGADDAGAMECRQRREPLSDAETGQRSGRAPHERRHGNPGKDSAASLWPARSSARRLALSPAVSQARPQAGLLRPARRRRISSPCAGPVLWGLLRITAELCGDSGQLRSNCA